MKDSASKNDEIEIKKKDNAEDLSLAELLGTGTDDQGSKSPRRATEGRVDEPSSGMVRLSAMIANASVEQAKTPSVVPPSSSMRPDATPTGGVHYSAPPTLAGSGLARDSQDKSSGKTWMIAIVALAAIAIGAYAYMRPGLAPSSNAELEKKMADLQAELEAAKASGNRDEAVEEKLKAKLADLEAAKATARKTEESSVAAVQEPAVVETPRHVAASARQSREAKHEKKTRKPAPARSKAKSEPPKAATKADSEPAKKPAANELDSLLGGGQKDAEPKKEAAAAGSGLPSQPDRADVQKAMGSVTTRAQACSKYSTGTIQLKLTVGNNGKVKSAEALGAFAGTTAGKCVEMLARAAKFPKFSDPTFSVTYPITLK